MFKFFPPFLDVTGVPVPTSVAHVTLETQRHQSFGLVVENPPDSGGVWESRDFVFSNREFPYGVLRRPRRGPVLTGGRVGVGDSSVVEVEVEVQEVDRVKGRR